MCNIVDFGATVRRFNIDDRVYSYSFDSPKGGFYAEYVARGPSPQIRAAGIDAILATIGGGRVLS